MYLLSNLVLTPATADAMLLLLLTVEGLSWLLSGLLICYILKIFFSISFWILKQLCDAICALLAFLGVAFLFGRWGVWLFVGGVILAALGPVIEERKEKLEGERKQV